MNFYSVQQPFIVPAVDQCVLMTACIILIIENENDLLLLR